MAVTTLDAEGLNRLLPIVGPQNAGEAPEVLATDRGVVRDFEAFGRPGGHAPTEPSGSHGVYRSLLKQAE